MSNIKMMIAALPIMTLQTGQIIFLAVYYLPHMRNDGFVVRAFSDSMYIDEVLVEEIAPVWMRAGEAYEMITEGTMILTFRVTLSDVGSPGVDIRWNSQYRYIHDPMIKEVPVDQIRKIMMPQTPIGEE